VSYLVDTCVISELVKPRPDRAVLSWFEGLPDELLHVSVLTLGEIRKGVEQLQDGKRKEMLRTWLEYDLEEWFGSRILPIDAAVADRWGRLLALAGRPVPTIDSLLSATALEHDLRLVTRNTEDFRHPGLEIIDTWAG
jgi:toxin FitB